MAWTLRGCLWHLRGAICRRIGPSRILVSIVLLLVICLYTLSSLPDTVLEGNEELSAGLLEVLTESSAENLDTELEEEVAIDNDYTDTEEQPVSPVHENAPTSNAQANKKNNRRRFVKAGKRKNIRKRPKQKVVRKKDIISKRKDKLMFPRTDLKWTDTDNYFLPNKPNSGANNYQEDAVIGNGIDWSMETEQERRRELRQRSLRVRRECERDSRGRLSRRLVPVYEHLNWVTRYSLIWCPVFKAGSTTWMKNLLLLAGETSFNGSIHNRASQLYQMPSSRLKQESLLEKSLKFMIVRHPFDRLLSAYRDKMLRTLKTTDPYRSLQLHILKNYPNAVNGSNTTISTTVKEKIEEDKIKAEEKDGNADNVSSGDADHPTFLQFLNKVRDDMKFFWKVMDGTLVDAHWTPYWYTCAPCQIRYDIVAKVETLDLDQEFLIRAANLQGVLVNAHTHASKIDGYTDSESASAQYFNQIPVQLLKELEELYWPDFKLFGYTSEKYLKMAKSDV